MLRLCLVQLCIAAYLACSACAAQHQPVRELTVAPANLEGKWRFRVDPDRVGQREGWFESDFLDGDWDEISVPGNWESQGFTDTYPGMPAPEIDPALAAFNAYNGDAWYRLHFKVPEDWTTDTFALSLGNVDDFDVVYLNGEPPSKQKVEAALREAGFDFAHNVLTQAAFVWMDHSVAEDGKK